MPICLIETREQLAALVERIFDAGVVALDTEFVWERTFFPALGLVQVAVGPPTGEGVGGCAPCGGVEPCLIDVPAVGDLSLLGLVLVSPKVVKIVHDGQQDLTIMRRAAGCGAPRNIFDTRLAAGFCGQSSVISLTNLLTARCGLELDKSVTRTDWLRRPLSEAQLAYALDDVRYLPALWEGLGADLEARGHGAAFTEESRGYEDELVTAERAPEEAYLRVKGRGRLGAEGLAVLQALTAWREREAAHRDRPRGHVLEDESLVALATRLPDDARAVGRAAGLGRRKIAHYADKLARIINGAREAPSASWPTPLPRRHKAKGAGDRAAALIALVEERGAAAGIDPALIASRAELRSLAALEPAERLGADCKVLRGWRRGLLGAELLSLLEGEGANPGG